MAKSGAMSSRIAVSSRRNVEFTTPNFQERIVFLRGKNETADVQLPARCGQEVAHAQRYALRQTEQRIKAVQVSSRRKEAFNSRAKLNKAGLNQSDSI